MADFDSRMEVLRGRFVARCAERRGQLLAALAAGDHAATVRIAHDLAGTAGLFGYPELSLAAQQLEEAARGGGAAVDDVQRCGDTVLQALPRQGRDAPA